MEINKYALFADVAETKNFTKSGERMGYTQPGVSHVLKTLESELGFPLFLRTKKGIGLAPNAEALLPMVRQLLSINEQLDQTIADFNGLKTGHLTIASFASISRNWLPAIIHTFQEEYPGIEIELMEGGTDEIVGWVENHRADFGLISKRHTNSLEWISLYEDPLVAILPKSSKKRTEAAYPIKNMEEKPFIISAEGTDYDIHYAIKKSGIHPNACFSSKDDLAIVTMVANKLGLSILPKLVVSHSEDLVDVLPLEPYCSRELGIAMCSRKSLAPAAARFITILQNTLPAVIQK